MLLVYKDRGIAYDVVIRDGAGKAIWPKNTDVVRVRITRLSEEMLVVTSERHTAGGSCIVVGNPTKVCLAAADLGFLPGTYTFQLDLYDGDGGEWKMCEKFVLHLEGE